MSPELLHAINRLPFPERKVVDFKTNIIANYQNKSVASPLTNFYHIIDPGTITVLVDNKGEHFNYS
ncbi:MAG: hypothetical protein PHW50_02085, partial [Patescibacteria group bacterium]|nr:hypothetical protein [Patescibacteria group bacterium]